VAYSSWEWAAGSTEHVEVEMKCPGVEPCLIHYYQIRLVETADYQMRANHTAADPAYLADPGADADPGAVAVAAAAAQGSCFLQDS